MPCVSNNCTCILYTGSTLENIGVVSGENLVSILTKIDNALADANPKTITLSGDITGIGSSLILTTLKTVNPTPGTFGDSTHVPVFSVNEKGLITYATNVAISGGGGDGTPGGSPGQLQWNQAGAFGGTTAGGYATSGNLFTFTAQAASDIPLVIQGATSQSGNLTNWKNVGGTTIASISLAGALTASNFSGTHAGASSNTNTGDQTITLTGDVTGSGTASFATAIGTNKVTSTMIRQSAGLSVIGRSANSTGNVADITAVTDGHVLRLSGTTLGFGTVATAGITNTAVTYAKIQNVTASSLLGNPTGGSTVASEITLDTSLAFTGSVLGVVTNTVNQKVNVLKNASSIGTRKAINFIEGSNVAFTITDNNTDDRIDVTLDATAGGGGGTPGGSNGQIQYNNSGAFGGTTGGNFATSGNLFLFTAQAVSDIPVTIKAASSQTADLQRWTDSSNAILARVSSAGNLTATNLSGTNTGNVTKSGENYISLSGQAITANSVDLSGTNVTGILAAGRFPALTGDVTTSAGSLATSITNLAVTTAKINTAAVTYAKIQNISTNNRLLGRSTAGAGATEEITVGSGLTLTGGTLTASASGGSVTSVAISSTDISVSGSPITTAGTITLNINNSVVTYAKIQNVSTQKLLGRYAAGSGVVQEVTLGSGLSLDSGTGILAVTSGGTGTVTSVGVTGNNGIGVAGSPVTTAGTITLSLGAITPTSVNGLTLAALTTGFSIAGGTSSRTLTVPGNATISGTNTGDISLSGETYISLSGQALVAGAVNLSGTQATGVLAAARFPALTGDVTTSSGSLATTIANNAVTTAKIIAAAVTYPKIQNVSTNNRLLGRATTGAGVIEEIIVGSGLQISGTTLSTTGGGGGVPKTFQNLSAATTSVVWDYTGGFNAYLLMNLTNTTNRILSISGDADGDYGTIIIEQGGGGGNKINIPTTDLFLDGINVVGSNTLIDLKEAVSTTTIPQVDILSYVKRGTRRYWSWGWYHRVL